MANPTNAKTKILAEHGEKIALGSAAVLLVGYLVASAAFSKSDDASRRLADWATTVDTEAGKDHGTLAPPKGGDLTRTVLAPYNAAPPSPVADPWIGSYATRADVKTSAVVVAKEKARQVADVLLTRSQTELGKVTIFFEPGLVDVNKYDEAPIDRFLVERRKESETKWTALAADYAPVNREYVDEKVDPSTVYVYRVTAHTSDAKAANANKQGWGKTSPEHKVTSADIWKFTVLQAFMDEDADTDQLGKGRAQIVITKFEKEAGAKFEYGHTYDGEKGDVKLGFENGTSKLKRTKPGGGGMIDVDFNCDLEILCIRENSKRSKPGRRALDIVLVRTSNKKLPKVVLQWPEDQEAKPPAPPDPKKKEEDAAKGLAEADKLWETDKKAAGAKYALVLKDFADTEAVKKRKAELEERVKTAPK